MIEKAKFITDEKIINKLISLDENSENNRCDKDTFIWLFGSFNGKRRCKTYDYIKVPPNSYGPEGNKNKNEFTTTAGIFFFNKLFIENTELFSLFKYINEPLTSGYVKKLSERISYAILDEEISLQAGKDFFQKFQWILSLLMIIGENDTSESIEMLKKINKKKEEYLKKYKKELENNDEHIMAKIEKELLDYGKSLLKDLNISDIYESGMCSYGNHFKDLFLMKGMAKDPDPKNGYHFITGSYMDGMDKESYFKLIRTQAAGPYSRGKLTQTGGTMEKQMIRAFSSIRFEPNTDCGTKKYIKEFLTEKNINKYYYSYIIEGTNLTLLTYKNREKFLNKECKIRFPTCCKRTKNNNICHKCMGDLLNRLGIEEVGILTANIGSSLKNGQMKAFHDGQVSYSKIDINKAFNL